MAKIEVGQVVWVKHGRGKRELVKDKVKTVKRKYFTLELYDRCKFKISDLQEEGDFMNSRVYLNDLDYRNEVEFAELRSYLISKMNTWNIHHNYSLDQLRRITLIVNEVK